jgi:hypothetical protein
MTCDKHLCTTNLVEPVDGQEKTVSQSQSHGCHGNEAREWVPVFVRNEPSVCSSGGETRNNANSKSW